jgi:hypothetical protein
MAKLASAPNFSSILDTPADQIERPKPLPAGTYRAIVQGIPRQDVSSKKQTPFVEFTLKLLAADEDVDQEELAAIGGLTDKTIKDTYYLTENSLFRVKDFLASCGVDVDSGASLRQLIEQTPNKEVGVFIAHEPSQDGEAVFARVKKTFAVE